MQVINGNFWLLVAFVTYIPKVQVLSYNYQLYVVVTSYKSIMPVIISNCEL